MASTFLEMVIINLPLLLKRVGTLNLREVGRASSLPVKGASCPVFQAARCRQNRQTRCLPYKFMWRVLRTTASIQ
jgi:hypothetical protein